MGDPGADRRERANIVFSITLFQWRKWGFYGFSGVAIVALVVDLIIGLNAPLTVGSALLGPVILYVVL
ncbi:MAG: hypothetical protein ACRDRW_05325 [Pseudonocardiaceae bacterium]